MHGGRIAYYVLGEGVVLEPPTLFGVAGQPAAAATAPAAPPKVPAFAFGRMFGRSRRLPPEDGKALFDKLIALGLRMNDPANVGADESDIPSGYTYLGQFIAHEITFDSTGTLLEDGMQPEDLRTPQIDLDSLYGGVNGPDDSPKLYEHDQAHLKLGQTYPVTPPGDPFNNDLLRDKANPNNPAKALIGDERNDENLALAQTHVAFINFHNKVVDELVQGGHDADGLFECARREVVRHFQWIVLNDYLQRLVDKDVLDCVLRHGQRWFKVSDGVPFMPLEFSAAAFRIGHSMVRRSYEWNRYHGTAGGFGPVNVTQLFQRTGFSRSVEGFGKSSAGVQMLSLSSDWIIDWRHFYDFTPLGNITPRSRVPTAGKKLNKSSKLDTTINFDLTTKAIGFPDEKLDPTQRAITVRNLLRGFYLGLPTGEEVAERMGETPLPPDEVADGPHKQSLSDPAFRGKTPLWYYILKEAELSGGSRLGPVGSRIVAETLVGIIRKSPYSILDDPDWRPKFGRPAQGEEPARFEMIDLLDFANVVSPLG